MDTSGLAVALESGTNSTHKNVAAFGKLDFPRLSHKLEASVLENVLQHKQNVANTTLNRTKKVSTKMTHDAQTGSEFFTTLTVRLRGSTNMCNLIKVCHGLKAQNNKGINVEHEVVNHLGCLSIRDSLPNDAKVTTKDATKLGAMIAAVVKMQMIIMSCIEELIHNAKKEFLV